MYQAIVFLPLLGAIIAGLIALLGAQPAPSRRRGRRPRPRPSPRACATIAHDDHARPWHDDHEPAAEGSRPAEIITSGFLVVSAVLSWIAFFTVGFGDGEPMQRAGAELVHLGHAGRVDWALRIDTLTVGHAGRGHHRLVARPRLFDRLHGARPAPAALLRLSVAVHLRHADAGDGRQPRPAVLRLGGRRPRLLPADRLLVQAAVGQRRGDQGLRRQPRRRLRLRARHLRRLLPVQLGRLRHDLRQRAERRRHDDPLPRLGSRRADGRLPAAVHGRDGQVGAVPAAHLAARRDGRPDAGLGAHPCRDHGDGRRVHGGAPVAAVRACADGARPSSRSSARRRPSSPRPSASCRTTSSASSPIRPARSSATCSWRSASAPIRVGDLPPLHPRLLQGAAVPRRRLGHPRGRRRAGHAQDGRAADAHPAHLLDDDRSARWR